MSSAIFGTRGWSSSSGGVVSIMDSSQQPEDYTVPRCIHNAAATLPPKGRRVGKENTTINGRAESGNRPAALLRATEGPDSPDRARASRNRIPQRQQRSGRSHSQVPCAKV